MSTDDTYFKKLSALNKDFECWLPFQPDDKGHDDQLNRPGWAEVTDEHFFRPTAVQEPEDVSRDTRTWKTDSSSAHRCRCIRNYCSFCRQNGERAEFYKAHRLRDESGRLECPVLRAHICPVCRKTGDEAHTISYCPVLKAKGVTLPKTAVLLKKTLYDSCGRRRRR